LQAKVLCLFCFGYILQVILHFCWVWSHSWEYGFTFGTWYMLCRLCC